MSDEASGSATVPVRRLYRGLCALALLVAAVFLATGAVQAATSLTESSLALTFPVTVPIPQDELASSWGLRLTSASFSQVDVMVTGVGPVNRILLTLADLLAAISFAVMALTAAILCRRLAKGAPFARASTSAVFVSGAALIVGGGGSQILREIVRWNIPEHWDGHPLFTYTGGLDTSIIGLTLGLTPVIAGLLLILIGVVFRHGERSAAM